MYIFDCKNIVKNLKDLNYYKYPQLDYYKIFTDKILFVNHNNLLNFVDLSDQKLDTSSNYINRIVWMDGYDKRISKFNKYRGIKYKYSAKSSLIFEFIKIKLILELVKQKRYYIFYRTCDVFLININENLYNQILIFNKHLKYEIYQPIDIVYHNIVSYDNVKYVEKIEYIKNKEKEN